MKMSAMDKVNIFLAGTNQKVELMTDIARLLEQDLSLPEIAADFESFGSSLEQLVGKRIRYTTTNARPISEAFEGVISNLAVQTLKSGESSGDLASAFRQSVEAIKSNEGLFGALVRGYTVPIIMLFFIALGVSMLPSLVFEQLKNMQPYGRWPVMSRMLYDLAVSLAENRLLITVGILVFIVAVGVATSKLTGPVRNVLDKAPFFKQYRLVQANSVLGQLATMIDAGVSLVESVEWVKSQQNAYAAYHLNKIARNIQEVKQAGNLGRVMATGLINEREVNRLTRPVAENMMGDMLKMSADNHKVQLQRKVAQVKVVGKFLPLVVLLFILLWTFASILFLVLSVSSI